MAKPESAQGCLGAKDIAVDLNISERQVHRLWERRMLPHLRIGGRRVTERAEFEKFKAGLRVTAEEALQRLAEAEALYR